MCRGGKARGQRGSGSSHSVAATTCPLATTDEEWQRATARSSTVICADAPEDDSYFERHLHDADRVRKFSYDPAGEKVGRSVTSGVRWKEVLESEGLISICTSLGPARKSAALRGRQIAAAGALVLRAATGARSWPTTHVICNRGAGVPVSRNPVCHCDQRGWHNIRSRRGSCVRRASHFSFAISPSFAGARR